MILIDVMKTEGLELSVVLKIADIQISPSTFQIEHTLHNPRGRNFHILRIHRLLPRK